MPRAYIYGMPDGWQHGVIYDAPKVGDRIRVALAYEGKVRPLLWLRVGRDGSIYLGLLLNQPNFGASATYPASSGQPLTIRDADALPVGPGDLRKGSRVSFKASGEVHLGSRTRYVRSLRSIERPRQLCLLRFIHPSRYHPPTKQAKNDFDVLLPYVVDDRRPIHGVLFVGPPYTFTAHPPPVPSSMSDFKCIPFEFYGLSSTPDYSLAVVIGHGLEGDWPSLPAMVILGSDEPIGAS